MIIIDYLLRVKKWIRTNPLEFVLLLVIILTAVFLRLYKIGDYMTFLGDEGRDVIVVRRLLVYGDPILIGPGTSIGGMYLGPLYYYMMAPILFLAGFSPVGPAVQVALLGVVTVFLVWLVAREWYPSFNGAYSTNWTALIAAGLYAISPTVIHFSRSSWNPNIMPFFSLLSVYSIWKVYKDKNYNWLIVVGISFAFVLQSHYLGLLLAPTILLFWILVWKELKSNNKKVKNLLRFSFFGFSLFALLMSPLLVFDIRHDWMNSKALYKFFTVRQETVSARPWSSLPKVPLIFKEINTSLVGGKSLAAGGLVSGLLFTALVYNIVARKSSLKKFTKSVTPQTLLLISWLGFGLVGFGLYKQHVYDHYFGFIFVVPYLLTALLICWFLKSRGPLKYFGISLLIYLIFTNLAQNPLRYVPNKQMDRSKNVADKILQEARGQPFDLAVLADRNYEDGYRYFLELKSAKVLHADRWVKSTIADQLFVVCELPKEKCDPTHSPKAEVANFGMSKIDSQWEESGVIIYRLIHSR